MTYPFLSAGIGFIPLRGKNEDGEVVVRAWALVDAADFMDVVRFNWHLTDTGYAARWYGGRPPRRKRDRMHRRVLGLLHGDKRQADHINRNRLDNRRTNLRIVAGDAENRQNVPAYRGGTSTYRGVSWDGARQKWAAQGQVAGKHKMIGRFDTEQEAAEAARAWRAEHMSHAVD